MAKSQVLSTLLISSALAGAAFAQGTAPSVRILLPERTRLLQGQLVDLVLEVRNATGVSGLSVTAGGVDITSRFGAAVKSDLDCDSSSDWVLRANLQSFGTPGDAKLDVSISAAGTTVKDSRTIQVRAFDLTGQRKNVILFIGDAMGTAYRDAARLVSRAIVDASGKSSFREGVFDSLLEMDKMPVSGMSMTYGTDSVVPDSANTGSAWATGNKTFLAAVNSFTDGTDCRWRYNGQTNAANLAAMLDNPRVETLWSYLKRKFNYRTGIVTTAAVTDATPAVEGSYTAYRQTRLEIARQYRENPMLGGRPAFDVIFGGGADPFTAEGRPDHRNLIGDFQNFLGYRYVTTASQLKGISGGQPTLGLFKGSAVAAPASNGVATVNDVNMDVAYDKLKLQRPASEPTADLGTWTDQPMLDTMTDRAIEVLQGTYAGSQQQPFILMVEGASIDKQSHPNNAAGTIWDTIEFDKAVGVARTWAANRAQKDTLVVVTADHDQSMSIIGVSNVGDTDYFDRNKSVKLSLTSAVGDQSVTIFGDGFSNTRSATPFINSNANGNVVNNSGIANMPGTIPVVAPADDPASSTYSAYAGLTAYKMGTNGYPVNSGAGIRRIAVGFRTGDHTGSSVPVTAEGPGAAMFTGYMDQSDIFFKMAAALSNDTTDLDRLLDAARADKFPKTFGK